MPVYLMERFEVRPETIAEAEAAMRVFADYVRNELPGSSWTTYRDPDTPSRFVSILRTDDPRAEDRHRKAPGTQTFVAALEPLLIAAPDRTTCELVTSSDLGRRSRR